MFWNYRRVVVLTHSYDPIYGLKSPFFWGKNKTDHLSSNSGHIIFQQSIFICAWTECKGRLSSFNFQLLFFKNILFGILFYCPCVVLAWYDLNEVLFF